jgi:ribonuclease-3
VEKLYSKIAYQFKNPALLAKALRHRSIGKDNNERLEFLGDAVLGLIVAEYLCKQFPDADEGDLSRIRASLVQQSTLAAIARELHLGDYLQLGQGELKTGGADRESILADAFEALVCALYLDAGLSVCAATIENWFAARLNVMDALTQVKDPKTRLQELLQALKAPLPVYAVIKVTGKDHLQNFVVSCTIKLLGQTVTGTGNNRRLAEQNAATAALQLLGKTDE